MTVKRPSNSPQENCTPSKEEIIKEFVLEAFGEVAQEKGIHDPKRLPSGGKKGKPMTQEEIPVHPICKQPTCNTCRRFCDQ